MRIYLWLVVILGVAVISCQKGKAIQPFQFDVTTPHQDEIADTMDIENTDNVKWSSIPEDRQKELIDAWLSNNEKHTIDEIQLFSVNLLPRLYQHNNEKFIWTSKKNITDAYRALELSYLDGLRPEDYHQEELNQLREVLANMDDENMEESLFAKHDILLTDAILMYGFHLLIGKVDPAEIDPNWNYKNRTISESTIKSFFEIIQEKKLFEGFDNLRPAKLEYRAMMNAILYYRELVNEDWTTIEGFDKLEIGDTNQYVPLIRERLSLCCQWNEFVTDSMVFDSSLYKGIVAFQNVHGLEADGVIGLKTIELLNFSPKQRIEKLKVNLERLRWLHDEVEEYSIEVNIAAFKLYVKKENELIYECNVVTGQPYHKTPIFTAPMKYIDFNPTWTVPYSIATNEILPKLKVQGSSYLARNNMELLNHSGKAIDAGSVNFKELSAGKFPYIIRQKPGSDNALGVVKFMFPNQYSVYLHDTQSKTLFSKTSRAFSHGCIRVENPLQLAEILLDDKKAWDREKIDKVIETRKTKTVNLKRDVNVKLLYYTAGLFSDGTMFYLPDVYKRDEAILKKLEQPFEYNRNTLFRVYPDKNASDIDSLMKL
ncbi:MAG: L,D-transpeptidase family protein [Bacteroidetes bacterium]|nr:L,D-transpeptidase family protein [Bacteroidota bacterium]